MARMAGGGGWDGSCGDATPVQMPGPSCAPPARQLGAVSHTQGVQRQGLSCVVIHPALPVPRPDEAFSPDSCPRLRTQAAVCLGSKLTDTRGSSGLRGVPSLCHPLSLDPVYPVTLTPPFSPMQGSMSPQDHRPRSGGISVRGACRFHQVVRGLGLPQSAAGGRGRVCTAGRRGGCGRGREVLVESSPRQRRGLQFRVRPQTPPLGSEPAPSLSSCMISGELLCLYFSFPVCATRIIRRARM